MESTGRLFKCVHCDQQVIICRFCDRGQRYCSPGCSRTARYRNKKAANHRYQQSSKGRSHHARRMHDYRRRKQIVTYQGSPSSGLNGLLKTNPVNTRKQTVTTRYAAIPNKFNCHFCGRHGSEFVRLDFLRRHRVRYFNPFDPRGQPNDHSPRP